MDFSFLQSQAWASFQKSLGRDVFQYHEGGIWAVVVKRELPFGRSYLYIAYGPIFDFELIKGGVKNSVNKFVGQLASLARKEKSFFIKIEPPTDTVAETFYDFGFKKSNKEIQPHKTLVLDLKRGSDELLSGMHHKTRYNIKVAESHNITVVESEDIDTFLRLMDKTSSRNKFSSHPHEYYKKLFEFFKSGTDGFKIKLFLAKNDAAPLAAAMILLGPDGKAFYLHGGSDYKFRSLMAPYLLHWHIIRNIQREGITAYDMWGIDEKKWPGVTRFKLGWGGRVIEYPGSFDLVISKKWYALYNVYRKFFK